MTRIPSRITAMQGECIARLNISVKELQSLDDVSLEAILKEGFAAAAEKDRNREPIGNWNLVFAGNEFYDGLAAKEILTERHGFEYVLKIIGPAIEPQKQNSMHLCDRIMSYLERIL